MATPPRPHPTNHHPQHATPTRTDHPAGIPGADDAVLLYTPAEAAQQLRVRESWLRKKAAAREVPCTFLGKHLRFSPTDLATIINAAARPAIGRRPRRKPTPTDRDRDLPRPAKRSVHPHRDDHQSNGSSPWRG